MIPDNAILVVAHPDDEVLWFASVVLQVARVIVAFRDLDSQPGLGERRAAALARLPYRDLVALAIPEAGSFRRAAWDAVEPTPCGLAIADAAVRRRYEANFAALRTALRELLPGGSTVFTHNPWGEYGHEDHVQVHRAVASRCAARRLDVWTPAYCSARTLPFARRHAPSGVAGADIDRGAAQALAQIYRDCGCWTWKAGWQWRSHEPFLRAPFVSAAAVDRTPLCLIADAD